MGNFSSTIIELYTHCVDRIVIINPSFSVTADAIGLVQLQADLGATINFVFGIEDLQFTYPTNDPPATVGISVTSSRACDYISMTYAYKLVHCIAFNAAALPSENVNAQFGLNAALQV